MVATDPATEAVSDVSRTEFILLEIKCISETNKDQNVPGENSKFENGLRARSGL